MVRSHSRGCPRIQEAEAHILRRGHSPRISLGMAARMLFWAHWRVIMPQWESYEQVGTYLLDQFAAEFGLDRVEGKQEVPGQRSGTSWEIDAKGVRQGNDGFMIVEFRRYTTSRQSQEKIGGLAYRIIDTGAKGGIIVSPLGLQEGAGKIAAAEGIVRVILNENCNRYEYMMQFLNQVMIGLHDTVSIKETLDAEIRDKDGNVVRRERIEYAPNHAKKKEEKRWQEPILRNGELVISIPAALLRSGLCPFFHPDRARLRSTFTCVTSECRRG